jgi:hypothetical protein
MTDEIMTYIAARLLCLAFERDGTEIDKLPGRNKWKDCCTFIEICDYRFWVLWYNCPITHSTHVVKLTNKELFEDFICYEA